MNYRKKDEIYTLTRKEFLVFLGVMYGDTTTEISIHINRSLQTVNYHLGHIYKKFKIKGNGSAKRKNLIAGYQRDFFEMIEDDEVTVENWVTYHPSVFVDEEEVEELYSDIVRDYKKDYETPEPPENFPGDLPPEDPPKEEYIP